MELVDALDEDIQTEPVMSITVETSQWLPYLTQYVDPTASGSCTLDDMSVPVDSLLTLITVEMEVENVTNTPLPTNEPDEISAVMDAAPFLISDSYVAAMSGMELYDPHNMGYGRGTGITDTTIDEGVVKIDFILYPVGYWYTYIAPHLYMLARLETNPDLIKTRVYRDWVDDWASEYSWTFAMDKGLSSNIHAAIRDHSKITQWPIYLPRS
jgi:hypothetical protein